MDTTVASPVQKETAGEWDQRQDARREPAETAMEVSRVLQVKRWEVQSGPFRGFNSPPGRF